MPLRVGIVKEVFRDTNSGDIAALLIELPGGQQVLKSAAEVKKLDDNQSQESKK